MPYSAVATVILAVSGYNPFEAFGALLGGIFGRPKYVSNVIIKSTPIILTGVSVAFAYKMGLFNIGAEGQFIVGAVAANVVGMVCIFRLSSRCRWCFSPVWRQARSTAGSPDG